MKRLTFFISLILLLTISAVTLAHSGRTDKNGCHYNRKTGQRHCH